YWFYEYCGVGHAIVKEYVKFSAYLHLRTWERGNRRKANDHATNMFIIGKYNIDHRTMKTITWEPWIDSAVSEIEDLAGEARVPLDPLLSMLPHISPVALQKKRLAGFLDCEQFAIGEVQETYASYWAEQTLEVDYLLTDSLRMGNIDMFRPTALRAGIAPVIVTSASIHRLSQVFSLSGEAGRPDLGWHMEWIERREMLPITCLRDPPPLSSSNGAEELWHLTHGMRRLALAESARDTKRLQELTDGLTTSYRHIDSIDHKLYAHDLQLRRGHDVRVVPLPHGGGTRTRQRRSGLQTRGGGTSRRGGVLEMIMSRYKCY
ncbi:hypothetical protein GIB67_032058, partial [Kingdonia uniflora]